MIPPDDYNPGEKFTFSRIGLISLCMAEGILVYNIHMTDPLFHKIDCVELPVPDLEAALRFYRDTLGHTLVWRTATSAGLRMAVDDGTEIVLQTERPERNIDLLVTSADEAARTFEQAGGTVIVPPFDIQIGRAVVVKDPFGNVLVLLDSTRGLLLTDADGNIIGNQKRD